MPDPFPHSSAYLARQSARQAEIDCLKAKQDWTDAQFLAERDAAYVAEQRRLIPAHIETLRRDMADDPDTEGYVAFYHTDER